MSEQQNLLDDAGAEPGAARRKSIWTMPTMPTMTMPTVQLPESATAWTKSLPSSSAMFSAFSSSPTSAAGRASPPSPQVPLTPRQPTLTLAIPFPDPPASCTSKNVPPFLLYSPLPAAHLPPEPGEKESLQKKAERTWQEHEREAKDQVSKEGKDAAFKSKFIGKVSEAMSWTKNSRVEYLTRTPSASELRAIVIVFPASYPAETMQAKFTAMLKATKNAALRNGVLATLALPFVLVIDVTFIPGPFEINAVLAVASWQGAARASAISNGVANNKVTCSFVPDERIDHFALRLHELCWENRKPNTPMEAPRWKGEHEPLRGVELAALALALSNVHLELGADIEYERDLERLALDLDQVLRKGAKEWLAAIS